MSHIKFQDYLHAKMAHTSHTCRRLAHGHLHPASSIPALGIDGRYPRSLQRTTMLPPTTFFEDSFHPTEQEDGGPIQQQLPAFSFRPLTPFTNARSASPMVSQHTEATPFPAIPAPGILNDDVDTSEWSPVGEEELAQAQIEYDSPSPVSLDSHSVGPYTPLTDAGSSFSDSRIHDRHQRSSLTTPGYHEFHLYTSRHGHPVHNLQTVALRPNHLALWNGQSCSAPASLPAGHLTLLPCHQVPSNVSEHSILHGLPEPWLSAPTHTLARPINGAYVLPTDVLSQSFSSTSTDLSHGFSISELNTSDTEIESSDDDEDDDEDDTSLSTSRHSHDAGGIAAIKRRSDRDGYLLKLRAQGISYKEIKRRGGFREAESTLRGRVRMLTKEKSERVRKPVWTPDDLALLHRAVDALSEQRTGNKVRNAHKIPWKKVSQYIVDNGGTYQFAPATCAKKWDDTVGRR